MYQPFILFLSFGGLTGGVRGILFSEKSRQDDKLDDIGLVNGDNNVISLFKFIFIIPSCTVVITVSTLLLLSVTDDFIDKIDELLSLTSVSLIIEDDIWLVWGKLSIPLNIQKKSLPPVTLIIAISSNGIN